MSEQVQQFLIKNELFFKKASILLSASLIIRRDKLASFIHRTAVYLFALCLSWAPGLQVHTSIAPVRELHFNWLIWRWFDAQSFYK